MTYAARKKQPARHWLLGSIDHLEGRALMTASTVTKLAFAPVHAELTTTQHTASKPVHLAATTHVHGPAPGHEDHQADPHRDPAGEGQRQAPEGQSDQADRLCSVAQTGQEEQCRQEPRPGCLDPRPGRWGVWRHHPRHNNQGQGQTIAIVDEYHDPNITADANAFSTQYSLQQFNVTGGPMLTVYKDTTFGAVANSPVGPAGTSIETSLDVEWAHAIAPKANILLVEVPAANDLPTAFKELLHGVQYAAGQTGVSVVSLSYGYVETNVGFPFGGYIGLPALY